ncbi:MAG TPA: DEAD/DEAH box helicase [bacterium]|nr:DEAD/DEAH box helicase [bacterium]
MDLSIGKSLILRNLSKRELGRIKSDLTFLNPAWDEAIKFSRSTWGIKKYIRLYKEKERYLEVPRGYLYDLISLFGYPESVLDTTSYFPPVEIESKIQLRPLQAPWVDAMLKVPQGLGIAPSGCGKTVMLLEVIAKLGQPTLWLTHRERLLVQFVNRTKEFLGDVGHIGIIGGGEYSIGDVITVGMVDTLAERDLSEIWNKFGLIVVDEGHRVPCDTMYKVITQFSARRLYIITATPYRQDGLEPIMFRAAGPAIATITREEAIEANLILPAKILVVNIDWPDNCKNLRYQTVMKKLAHVESRNDRIATDILIEAALGNVCIILTVQVKHGKMLKEKLAELGVEAEHVHAKTSEKKRNNAIDRFEEGEIQVLIATYNLLSEGFDNKFASRLFLAAPRKSKALVTQSIGRIERVAEGKTNSLVYDYVDTISSLTKQFYARERVYEENLNEIIYLE